MERIKWTDKIKNAILRERIWRKKNNAGTDKEEEKKLAVPLAKKELPAEGCSRRKVNRNKVHDRRRYQMIDSIMINFLYEDTKRKAEKRVGWILLSLQ